MWVQSPVGELDPKCLGAKKPKHRSKVVTNSIKTLKMVHINNNLKKKKKAARDKHEVTSGGTPIRASADVTVCR